MASTAQVTDFSRDVLGRFVCNSLPEALASTDSATRPGVRPFDIIVAGGGSFGGVFAQHLLTTDLAHHHRTSSSRAAPSPSASTHRTCP